MSFDVKQRGKAWRARVRNKAGKHSVSKSVNLLAEHLPATSKQVSNTLISSILKQYWRLCAPSPLTRQKWFANAGFVTGYLYGASADPDQKDTTEHFPHSSHSDRKAQQNYASFILPKTTSRSKDCI